MDLTVGGADAALDQLLSDELDRWNDAATVGVAPQRELTVKVEDAAGVVAGASGWTWGEAAGIGLMWVRASERGGGLGVRVLRAFENEARGRGCTHVFTTSFTFQAPGFYERAGYAAFARWEGLPRSGDADVHLRKEL